ncbi:MAG: 4-(cytidine 5'-diphospho)-2-C-methyl-D-erythritol kinase [Cyclobacteriaceae bacterium]|nr:4-(cytidine 5'-diphospho)-2-C-methyl-D-erythritol kinase [Cyclobacteriaceae bacterium]
MVVFPPCKINLGLHILQKRADGYHDLETCFYPVPWTDILEIIPSRELSFTSTGNAIPGSALDNLCLRAYALLKADFGLEPVAIHLHKLIPTGAGLGGGSSDAAYTLRLLNEIFQLKITQEKMVEYAAQLGSDCAFFIQDKPMMGSGRGEILSATEVNLSGKFLVLVKPDIHVSTAEAYAGIFPKKPAFSLTEILIEKNLLSWKECLKNDFEDSVFFNFPMLRSIKEKLYSLGALYASMSGSGSSVFGIFENECDLKPEFNNVSFWSGKL